MLGFLNTSDVTGKIIDMADGVYHRLLWLMVYTITYYGWWYVLFLAMADGMYRHLLWLMVCTVSCYG